MAHTYRLAASPPLREPKHHATISASTNDTYCRLRGGEQPKPPLEPCRLQLIAMASPRRTHNGGWRGATSTAFPGTRTPSSRLLLASPDSCPVLGDGVHIWRGCWDAVV
ncbi:hypothetical protein VTK73DRAFT_5188 [Phialemonium thermophilum]|uniref:Uncharacterized protein n=1 Tax=Phialemonium thermophilum TaxID=223376 RepID=A0ABR3V301_9PEZI